MKKKRVVVVLPAYNEKDSLEKFIPQILLQEKNTPGYEIHIVVGDDIRTSDGTQEMLEEKFKNSGKIHIVKTEPGIGVAIIKSHQYALDKLKPDVMAQLDADGQVDVDVLPKLVATIDQGYDLAIGSRFIKGGKNELSFTRHLFSIGASWTARIIMGPWDIKEVTNSARAFTPALFKRIDLDHVPWKEKTFIIQPAFLNEAVVAGAKYKEVPLVFRNREVGYSKNKVVNYIYDVVTYAVDARLRKWGIDIHFFKLARRLKTFLKFSIVGVTGTIVDLTFYNIFISFFGFRPAFSKIFSTEAGIVNNFTWNNLWTFKSRKTSTKVWQKFIIYNVVSTGALVISVLIIKFLHLVYGDGVANLYGFKIAYYNIYFFVTIPPVMMWNFSINHFVTWRHKE